jgi:hypothetical protein
MLVDLLVCFDWPLAVNKVKNRNPDNNPETRVDTAVLTNQVLCWDRGRLARNEREARNFGITSFLTGVLHPTRIVFKILSFGSNSLQASFALHAHCGRDARGPSKSLFL